MAAAGATVCSTSVGSQKMIKKRREYLHRVDRARFLRRDGSVLTCNWEALKQEMDKADAGRWQRMKIAIVCYSCGAAHPSRLQRRGNREAKRQRQRAKRERLRDERTVSQMLVRSLNPSQGGSNPRNPETTGKLQILQRLNVPNAEEGNSNLSIQDSPVYVGMDFHMPRLEDKNNGKEKKD